MGENQKYESISAAWVDALRRHVEESVAGKPVDFEVTFSAEYTNAPTHLLRKPGQSSVGYTVRARGGKIEVLDGPSTDTADAGVVSEYDPFALVYALPLEKYMEFLKNDRPALEAAGKMRVYGSQELITPLIPMLNMLGFYSRYTA